MPLIQRFNNFLSVWLLPPAIKSMLSKWFVKKTNTIPANLQLKGLYEGDTCYIVSCGPSLNNFDLKQLQGKNCITVSNAFVHPDFKQLNSIFHVFAARHYPITEEQFKNWFQDFKSKSTHQTKLFVSTGDYSMALAEFEKDNIFQYQTGGTFPVDLVTAIPDYNTVVHLAIYLAEYLGFSEINLLGVDHDQILNFGQSKHFYKEDDSKLVAGGYNEWSYYDLKQEFLNYYRLWDFYENIKTHCKAKIHNLNKDSFLNVFPKKDFQK